MTIDFNCRVTVAAPALLFTALLAGCSAEETSAPQAAAPAPVMSAEPALGSGIDIQYIDANVAPGDDFYAYVNGVWLDATPIPSDKSNYGSFTILADEAEASLREIIEAAAGQDAAPGTDTQKVGDFYTSFRTRPLSKPLARRHCSHCWQRSQLSPTRMPCSSRWRS